MKTLFGQIEKLLKKVYIVLLPPLPEPVKVPVVLPKEGTLFPPP